MVDAFNAKAEDFDRAAHGHAKTFWFLVVAGGLLWWLASIWWAALPLGLAAISAFRSIGATRAGLALRNGTYRLPNPNNGAPEGGAGE